MPLTSQQLAEIPSPYYRVATRAIILDDQQRILVGQDEKGNYELPGGGWEYGESFETCLAREIQEELGVELASAERDILCVYRGGSRHGAMLRIAVRATLKSYDFKPVDLAGALFFTKEEFLALDLEATGNEEIKQYADKIWPSSMDASSNTATGASNDANI